MKINYAEKKYDILSIKKDENGVAYYEYLPNEFVACEDVSASIDEIPDSAELVIDEAYTDWHQARIAFYENIGDNVFDCCIFFMVKGNMRHHNGRNSYGEWIEPEEDYFDCKGITSISSIISSEFGEETEGTADKNVIKEFICDYLHS